MEKNEFGKFLKEYMDNHGYKLEAFAVEVGYSFGLISHYINGRRSPSYKFINTFFKKFRLSEKEKIKILEILKQDKLPEEINELEKRIDNFSEDARIQNLNSKTRKQFDEFLEEAILMFNDEKIDDEDKEKLIESLKEVFFKAKELNKRKK